MDILHIDKAAFDKLALQIKIIFSFIFTDIF